MTNPTDGRPGRPQVTIRLTETQWSQYRNAATWDLARLQNNGLRPPSQTGESPGSRGEIDRHVAVMAQGAITSLHGAAKWGAEHSPVPMSRLPEPQGRLRVVMVELPASLDEGKPLAEWFDAKMASSYFPGLGLRDALNEMARTAVLKDIELIAKHYPEQLKTYPGGPFPGPKIVFRGSETTPVGASTTEAPTQREARGDLGA